MRKQKSVWFLILGLLVVLAGCGSDGNGGMTMMPDPDPDPDPMECPAGQTGTYPNCMTPPPPAPAGGHNAVIDGIVNPATAGDPSTARGTDTVNNSRPGEIAAEAFNVSEGDLGTEPITTIGNLNGTNAPDALQFDRLNKDDMAGTPMKSIEGQFMNQDMNSMLGGFAGSVHEKMTGEGDKKTVNTLNVFTNMDAAKSATYAEYYGGNVNRNGVTNYDDEDGALTLATGEATGMLSLFSGSMIPTGAGRTIDIPADDDATTAKENEFTGMFNGVAGTYACDGTCNAQTNGMSKLTLTGTWTFTPTEKDPMKIMLPGVNYDSDYLSFGYWVRTTGEGDDTKYGVGTFFDGSQDFGVAPNTLEGSATYSGKAAGMYGRKTLNQYGQVVSGSETSGHFTADANLTARFGGDDIAASKHDQIEGTVTKFMDGDEMISPNWELKLSAADISTVGAAENFNGETVGGGTKGNWIGRFFGNPAATTPVTPSEEQHPTSVAGEFTGHFTNGHVIGAFGATKDKE